VSRFLFVVPPLTGHVNPAVAVGAELTARGHDVAWAGHPGTLRPLLADDARVFAVVDDALADRLWGDRERWVALRGPAALKSFWEEFLIPLAQAMLGPTARSIAGFAPDVVIADQQALAGAAAARRAGVAWATSATTPGELSGSLTAMPRVEEWITGLLTALQLDNGITDPVDLRFSDQLVLAYTTEALFGDTTGFGPQYVFTGPALSGRTERGSFPWHWLDPGRPGLLVSLGTLNGAAGQRFFGTVLDALADLGDELQAVIAAPYPWAAGGVPGASTFGSGALGSRAFGSGALGSGALGSDVLGSGALGNEALRSGTLGSGALRGGALGSGALRGGALGSGALRSGALGNKALGSGLPGSGVLGNEALRSEPLGSGSLGGSALESGAAGGGAIGGAFLDGAPGSGVPPHILFAGHVPQLALLPRMSAVVSHGGHNTVCETLAHGLPLVVTPIRDDQPLIAQQVADAGAGLRLRFGRLRAGELRDAVRAVLGDPAYRTAAVRVRDSFTAAGGAVTAADHLEKLL
jgi:UDP:flavonoid glycosyltransferase YjiC (YdhE family)